MSLREDVKFVASRQFEPKIPNDNIILQQAKAQLKKGKTTGNMQLDFKAMKSLQEEQER